MLNRESRFGFGSAALLEAFCLTNSERESPVSSACCLQAVQCLDIMPQSATAAHISPQKLGCSEATMGLMNEVSGQGIARVQA